MRDLMIKRNFYLIGLLIANLAIIVAPLFVTLLSMIIILGLTIRFRDYWLAALLAGTSLISYTIGKIMPSITITDFHSSVNIDNLYFGLIIIPVPLIINSLFIWFRHAPE